MFPTTNQEEQVSVVFTRAFFTFYVLFGMAGILAVSHRYGILRPYLFPIPAAICGLSALWVTRKRYSKRAFQSRVGVLLALIGVEILLRYI